MRHPLVIVAILYAAGLVIAEYAVSPPLLHLLAFGLVLAVLALAWPRARQWLLIPLIITVGWANLVSRTAVLSPNDLRNLLPADAIETAVRGRLVTTPTVKMFVRGEEEQFHTLVAVEVTELRLRDKWVPAYGRVMTTTPESLEGLMYRGMDVEVSGIAAPPQRPVAPGLFDYRTYLRRQGIYFQLKAEGTGSWHVFGEVRPALSDRFLAWSRRILTRGLDTDDEPLRLLKAMTLGYQTGIMESPTAEFAQRPSTNQRHG